MHRDPVVMAYLGGVRDDAASAAYLERNLRHWAQHGFGLLIVYERDGSVPIGRAMLRWLRVNDEDEVEVGYAFYQPFWGRGLATEVTRHCIEMARVELGCESLVALTSPSNIGSQRVLTRIGFVHDREFSVDGDINWLFRYRLPHEGTAT
jgi:RimJ/RimL family protein N-acetyltransferase